MTHPLIALEVTRHRTHGWHRSVNYQFAARHAWAPLMLQELATAIAIYPVGLMKTAPGIVQPVAVLGLREEENLFLDAQGRWMATYIPAYFRAYPFSFQEAVAGEQRRQVLCIDTSSGLYREQPDAAKGDSRFFTDQGQPDPAMLQLLTLMKALQEAAPQTQRAAHALEAAGLLVPWALPSGPQAGAPVVAWPGLCRLDEVVFNQVDVNTLLGLRDQSALVLAYALLFSAGRINSLHRLAAMRQAATQATPKTAPDLSLVHKLFEPGESDTIQFNW